MSKFIYSFIVATSLLLSVPVNAGVLVFDFTTLTEGNEGNPAEYAIGATGINLIVTTADGDYIYSDGSEGLGVCQETDCSNNPDDNLAVGEWIEFSFAYDDDDSPLLQDFDFLFSIGNGHRDNGGTPDLDGVTINVDVNAVDAGDWGPLNTDEATADYFGHVFRFTPTVGELYFLDIMVDDGFSNQCFPDACDVPEPTTLAVFALGLVGILASPRKLIK